MASSPKTDEPVECITEPQAKFLRTCLKGKGCSEEAFCATYKIPELEKLPQKLINEALDAIKKGLIKREGNEVA